MEYANEVKCLASDIKDLNTCGLYQVNWIQINITPLPYQFLLLQFCVLFPFSTFPFPVTHFPIRFPVLVKVLWYTYLLYERDSVNLKK